ncbi:GNAT family N-acetyltransferase [Haloechinothrix halophila]|uniref:GNAT family N-acetyltransferase n=1 Tax=Haloechinothrix halophila TaxID=1069073 RepID=UPI000429242E|nr:GNAT family N-acetyltransferase [Haloechinothrix halophila]
MSLPQALTTEPGTFWLRRATLDDVPAVVDLIANDPLGRMREIRSGDLTPYVRSFHAIDSDPAHLLVVAVDDADAVVGTMQLTLIPGLARQGALRAQIETVRVREDCRSLGLGRAMMRWAIDESRRRGCALVQLTSHKKRTYAHRFYARLGFENSHEGLKLVL